MDIYAEKIKLGNLPNIRWFQHGRFCSRLRGINITQAEDQVITEPVYVPLIAIDKEGDITFVELSTTRPFLVIILMPFWPFIHIERTDKIQLEDE